MQAVDFIKDDSSESECEKIRANFPIVPPIQPNPDPPKPCL